MEKILVVTRVRDCRDQRKGNEVWSGRQGIPSPILVMAQFRGWWVAWFSDGTESRPALNLPCIPDWPGAWYSPALFSHRLVPPYRAVMCLDYSCSYTGPLDGERRDGYPPPGFHILIQVVVTQVHEMDGGRVGSISWFWYCAVVV